MTCKTCKTCFWCDQYLDHDYGYCDEHEKWVNLSDRCNKQKERNDGESGTETEKAR